MQSLSKKFNLRIVLNNKSPGRPSNNLSEDEVEWLCKFMEGPDITYTYCYLRDAGGKLINENVTIISEASDYSGIAAFSCINKVF